MNSTGKMFSAKLKELRIKKGLSRKALAAALEVSTASIGYYEHGDRKPDIEVLVKISNFFDVSCDYLLRGVESQNISIQSELGFDNEVIEQIRYIKQLQYDDILSDVLLMYEIIPFLDNLKRIIYNAYAFGEEETVVNEVFDEFLKDMTEKKNMQVFVSDPENIKTHLLSACLAKYNEQNEENNDFCMYKAKKALETVFRHYENNIITEKCNQMSNMLYLMYMEHCKEVSEDGQHNPQNE